MGVTLGIKKGDTLMIKKQFLKTKCKIEFAFPADITSDTRSVYLVGEFNNWSETETPMVFHPKSNTYRIVLSLKLNQKYQFRYLVNGNEWHNDWEADEYVTNAFGGDNSVVSTHAV